MESKDKLTVLENQLPLRAYPEDKLDQILKTVFKFWLANLLSIKADNENKLDSALPAIKKHFWSLGIHEIKKAFEMYADGELITKPIPNYFDRILVGSIFKEYKDQKPRPKPLEMRLAEPTEQEKINILANGTLRLFNEYKETGMVFPGNNHIYDYLIEYRFIKHVDKFWNENELQAKINVKASKIPTVNRKMKEVYIPKSTDTEIMSETKRLIIEKYFESKIKK